MTELIDKTYFVSKAHDAAKAMLSLLLDRLSDLEWAKALSTTSNVQMYSKTLTEKPMWTLIRTAAYGSEALYVNSQEISLAEYLDYQTQAIKLQLVLQERYDMREDTYKLAGSAESIHVYGSDSGMYLRCVGSQDTHDWLAEYYTLAEDASTTYSATLEGQLIELEEDFDND